MALTMRQGKYIDFDPSKLRAGEWAVVLANDPGTKDGKAVYICFSAGNVKRMATYEDMVDEIHNATGDVSEEITKEIQAKIKEASEMITEGNVVITNAEKTVGNAEAAAKLANDTAADIQQKLNDGELSAKITGVTAVTGEAGTQAKVENVGTVQDANFVFTIPKGDPGEPFRVKKTYTSIKEMEIGFYTDEDVKEGQFVVIDTGNVEDEDNAKLYMKGQTQYVYITDLSGATGLTGPPGPQGQAAGFGTPTATVDANIGVPSVTVTASGSDTEKIFSFEFRNLKGEPGATGAIDENSTITFSQAEVRQNIQSGETLKIIMGKMEKMIADLKQVAFTASYNDLVDTPEPVVIPESLPANGGNADTVGNKSLNYLMDYNNLNNQPDLQNFLPTTGGTMTGKLYLESGSAVVTNNKVGIGYNLLCTIQVKNDSYDYPIAIVVISRARRFNIIKLGFNGYPPDSGLDLSLKSVLFADSIFYVHKDSETHTFSVYYDRYGGGGSGKYDEVEVVDIIASDQARSYADIEAVKNVIVAELPEGAERIPFDLRASRTDRLNTARKISLTGAVTGEVMFDGSKDIEIVTKLGGLNKVGIAGCKGNDYRWSKIGDGYVEFPYKDKDVMFAVTYGTDINLNGGLLRLHIRTDDIPDIRCGYGWHYNYNLNEKNFVVLYRLEEDKVHYELWVRTRSGLNIFMYVLTENSRTELQNDLDLYVDLDGAENYSEGFTVVESSILKIPQKMLP